MQLFEGCQACARLAERRSCSAKAFSLSTRRSSRGYATEASTKHHLVAAALVSRPPLLLAPPTPFDKQYLAWSRRLHRALALPVNTRMYLRPGSSAERLYNEREKELERLGAANEDGEDEPEATPEELGEHLPHDNLQRKAARTLYLLLRRDRERHQWQFPQGAIEDSDRTLVDAALRGLRRECGPDLDVWTVGSLPAACFSYAHASSESSGYDNRETMVFYSPMHVLRGQVHLESGIRAEERIAGYAWLTKEEIQDRVGPDMWEAVEPVLLHQ